MLALDAIKQLTDNVRKYILLKGTTLVIWSLTIYISYVCAYLPEHDVVLVSLISYLPDNIQDIALFLICHILPLIGIAVLIDNLSVEHRGIEDNAAILGKLKSSTQLNLTE